LTRSNSAAILPLEAKVRETFDDHFDTRYVRNARALSHPSDPDRRFLHRLSERDREFS